MIGVHDTSGDRRVGRYVLGERIGQGGMAEVFIGHAIGARGFRKPVAIKRLLATRAGDLDSIERLIGEAKLLVGLQHGNVVSVLDLVCEGDDVFVVMEYVDGPSVRQLLKLRGELLPIAIATYVVHASAIGLEYAHVRPGGAVIHADISPSNLLLTRTGEVRVGDFGIARREGVGAGWIEGKWAYMAPEQARGELLTPRADVFSLGVVLYELVSGVRPRSTAAGYEHCLSAAEVTPLDNIAPGIPAALSRLCTRCLADEPSERPSMKELRDTLLDLRYAHGWREGAGELAELIREAAMPSPRMPHSVATALVSIRQSHVALTAPEPRMFPTGTVHGRQSESAIALSSLVTVPTMAAVTPDSVSFVLRSLEQSRSSIAPAQPETSVSVALRSLEHSRPSIEPAKPETSVALRSLEHARASIDPPASSSLSSILPASSAQALPVFALSSSPYSTISHALPEPRSTANRTRLVWIFAAGMIAGVAAAWIAYHDDRLTVAPQPIAQTHVIAPAPGTAAIADLVVEPIEPSVEPTTRSSFHETIPAIERAYRDVAGPVVRIAAPNKPGAPAAAPSPVEEIAEPPSPETAPAVVIDTPPSRTAAALITTGTDLFLAGKLDEAQEAFEGVLAIDPSNALAHRGLGFVFQRTGANAKAIVSLRAYLTLRPTAHDTAAIEARIARLGG